MRSDPWLSPALSMTQFKEETMLVHPVVIPGSGTRSWTVLGDDDVPVVPVDRFLAYLTGIGRSPNTVKAYAHDMKDLWQFLGFRGLDWREARLEDIAEFVVWLQLPAAGRAGEVAVLPSSVPEVSVTTVNRKLAAVSSFYAHQARNGERLRDRFFFALMHETGCRAGEVLGLRHEDIAAAECEITVMPRENANGARAKSGIRTVPVGPELIRLYADYLHEEYGGLDSDYVFVNIWAEPKGQAWSYQAAYDLVLRLRARTGLDFDPHWLRHGAATRWLRDGVSIEVVSKLLGHSSVTTTSATYGHLTVEDARAALEKAGWFTGREVTW